MQGLLSVLGHSLGRTGWNKSAEILGMSFPKLGSPESRHFHRFFSNKQTNEFQIIFSFKNAVAYQIFSSALQSH